MGEIEVSEEKSPQSGGGLVAQFERMRRELDELWAKWPDPRTMLGAGFVPPADVEELDDAWMVDIELPGMAKNDVDIEVTNRTLVVSGERKEKERTGILRHKKRVTGRFRYEVTVSSDIDENAVSATLSDGELRVRLPKTAADQPRRIEIT